MARSVSLRSVAPLFRLVRGLPLRRGGTTGSARGEAKASWAPRVTWAPSPLITALRSSSGKCACKPGTALPSPYRLVGPLGRPDRVAAGIDHEVDLVPDPPLVGPVPSHLPFALAGHLQTCAVDHEVSGPPRARQGISTVISFRRRERVLSWGGRQSSPARRIRLPARPWAARGGNWHSTFGLSTAWMAASVKIGWRPLLPVPLEACQVRSGEIQTGRSPRAFSPRSDPPRFRVRQRG